MVINDSEKPPCIIYATNLKHAQYFQINMFSEFVLDIIKCFTGKLTATTNTKKLRSLHPIIRILLPLNGH